MKEAHYSACERGVNLLDENVIGVQVNRRVGQSSVYMARVVQSLLH